MTTVIKQEVKQKNEEKEKQKRCHANEPSEAIVLDFSSTEFVQM